MADYQLIETRAALEAVVKELRSADVIAIDTEADSFYHYFDKTCLIQIASRKQIYLIDPLALGSPEEMAPLGPIFGSRHITKVFHAADYDLYVMTRDYGFVFRNLFDTMISAQLLGYPAVGLAGLAERHFGVNLPKDEQRSDWSTRPLSAAQLSYAAADVLYLIELSEKLTQELRRAKRLRWAEEEFRSLTEREWPERSFDDLGYLRIKGARRLDAQGLSILRELFLMRDRRAREIDRPPFKVLGNRTLLDIAERKPTKLAELGEIKGITELLLRRMGRQILDAIREGRKQDHGPIPKLGTSKRRIERHAEGRLLALKDWRAEAARRLSLDPGVLCPNATLEAIAMRAPTTPRELREVREVKDWFQREFGAEVLAVCSASDTAQADGSADNDSGRRRGSQRSRAD